MNINLRTILPVFFLILLAFNSGIRLFVRTVLTGHPEIDRPTFQENRLKGLKESLPERAILGFVQEDSTQHVEKLREFFLTQYALVPLIITKGEGHDLIVANFKTDVDLKRWLEQRSFLVLKDLKNGVALIQKKTR